MALHFLILVGLLYFIGTYEWLQGVLTESLTNIEINCNQIQTTTFEECVNQADDFC